MRTNPMRAAVRARARALEEPQRPSRSEAAPSEVRSCKRRLV